MSSLFITFEGLDGSGKTTQIQLLDRYLRQKGHVVHCAREPGGTSIGEQVRHILHDVQNAEMHPLTEILLYSASRAQLVVQVIRPTLNQGGIVLCDRYVDSTYAYQGYGHRLSLNALQTITCFATDSLKPDLTILLDVPAKISLKRRKQANLTGEGEWNRMDQMKLDFYERVRQGYTALAQVDPERWYFIDASLDIEAIHQQICSIVDTSLTI